MASETNLTKIKTTSLVFITYIMASAFVLTVSYMFSLKSSFCFFLLFYWWLLKFDTVKQQIENYIL